MDEEDLERIRPLADVETYRPGDAIVRHGQGECDLFIIESGGVRITNPIDDDRELITHHRGQFIGDIDLLTRRPPIIDATAIDGEDTRVLRVRGEHLQRLLATVPRVSEKLLTAIQIRRKAVNDRGLAGIRVVGPGGCQHTNRVREFLHKNFVPFTWDESDSDAGRKLLKDFAARDAKFGKTRDDNGDAHQDNDHAGGMPAVDCGNGAVLRAPSLHDVAHCAGVWRGCPTEEADLAVVGAGPAGLAAAVYAASEGIKTVVLDQLGPGGQAGGSSLIENFIGFPAGLSGTDLATRGVLQMLKFGAKMIAPVRVERLEVGVGDAPHQLHLDCGSTLRAHVVLVATGVTWKRLEAENAGKFERAGVYYACTSVEAALHATDEVAVVGGGNSAGQAVMFLADQSHDRKVHHIVRSPLGKGMSSYLVERIRSHPNVTVHEGYVIDRVDGKDHIDSVELAPVDAGERKTLPCRGVYVFIGADPCSDWLPADLARDDKGYLLAGADVVTAGKWTETDRTPCPLETSVPRLLAGGDVRAGSTKRVGFAVGDGSLACTCVHKLRGLRR